MKNKDIFMAGEGDAYFTRNNFLTPKKEEKESLLLLAWNRLPFAPKCVLEVGCSSGNNLQSLMVNPPSTSSYYGIDPSAQAIEEGKKAFPSLNLSQGTADSLKFENNFFDAIIFGCCLYLCDREYLFKIAYEADRCLQGNGFIVIVDFKPDFYYKNTYHHCSDVFTHKLDYSQMFLWNPQYSLMEMYSFSHLGNTFHPDQNERVAIQVLYKNTSKTYGLTDPYK